MDKLARRQIGKCGELLVQYILLKHGIESAPLTTDPGIDLIAFPDIRRQPLKIQVKTSTTLVPLVTNGSDGKYQRTALRIMLQQLTWNVISSGSLEQKNSSKKLTIVLMGNLICGCCLLDASPKKLCKKRNNSKSTRWKLPYAMSLVNR